MQKKAAETIKDAPISVCNGACPTLAPTASPAPSSTPTTTIPPVFPTATVSATATPSATQTPMPSPTLARPTATPVASSTPSPSPSVAASPTPMADETNLVAPFLSDAAGFGGASHLYGTIAFPRLKVGQNRYLCARGNDGIWCSPRSANGKYTNFTLWTASFRDAEGWAAGEQYWATIRYADVNGDGKDDICGRSVNGIVCALAGENGFGAANLWSSHYSDAEGWSQLPSYYTTIRFIDLNRDGKADVCGRTASGIYCALSTGSGFGPASYFTNEFSDAAGWGSSPSYWRTIQYVDLDGDGRTDICGRGVAGMRCLYSSGSTFTQPINVAAGLTDAGGWNASSVYETIRMVKQSDGSAILFARGVAGIYEQAYPAPLLNVVASFSNAENWHTNASYWSTIDYPDITGDGRTEVCGRSAQGIYCAVRQGTSTFAVPSLWTAAFSNAGGWQTDPKYWSTLRFVDVNDDGKADVCARGARGLYCYLSNGAAFN